MAENKISLPSSGGGLLRYFDETKSKMQITPTIILVAIVVVTLIELYLYKFGI